MIAADIYAVRTDNSTMIAIPNLNQLLKGLYQINKQS